MKIYLISLGAGLLVGVIYSLLHVRSPAPPVVALVGLLGILIGEQAVPVYRWLTGNHRIEAARHHLFGEMPSSHVRKDDMAEGKNS
ncbi:MAG: XapX domain-containing protein [Rhodobacteraceae bacterium]|nr:XapX domain-containing protein [Paracoccaceae bacterium]MAY43835.1 XapX domain-containing protein [Paracoccaceae bacterium]